MAINPIDDIPSQDPDQDPVKKPNLQGTVYTPPGGGGSYVRGPGLAEPTGQYVQAKMASDAEDQDLIQRASVKNEAQQNLDLKNAYEGARSKKVGGAQYALAGGLVGMFDVLNKTNRLENVLKRQQEARARITAQDDQLAAMYQSILADPAAKQVVSELGNGDMAIGFAAFADMSKETRVAAVSKKGGHTAAVELAKALGFSSEQVQAVMLDSSATPTSVLAQQTGMIAQGELDHKSDMLQVDAFYKYAEQYGKRYDSILQATADPKQAELGAADFFRTISNGIEWGNPTGGMSAKGAQQYAPLFAKQQQVMRQQSAKNYSAFQMETIKQKLDDFNVLEFDGKVNAYGAEANAMVKQGMRDSLMKTDPVQNSITSIPLANEYTDIITTAEEDDQAALHEMLGPEVFEELAKWVEKNPELAKMDPFEATMKSPTEMRALNQLMAGKQVITEDTIDKGHGRIGFKRGIDQSLNHMAELGITDDKGNPLTMESLDLDFEDLVQNDAGKFQLPDSVFTEDRMKQLMNNAMVKDDNIYDLDRHPGFQALPVHQQTKVIEDMHLKSASNPTQFAKTLSGLETATYAKKDNEEAVADTIEALTEEGQGGGLVVEDMYQNSFFGYDKRPVFDFMEGLDGGLWDTTSLLAGPDGGSIDNVDRAAIAALVATMEGRSVDNWVSALMPGAGTTALALFFSRGRTANLLGSTVKGGAKAAAGGAKNVAMGTSARAKLFLNHLRGRGGTVQLDLFPKGRQPFLPGMEGLGKWRPGMPKMPGMPSMPGTPGKSFAHRLGETIAQVREVLATGAKGVNGAVPPVDWKLVGEAIKNGSWSAIKGIGGAPKKLWNARKAKPTQSYRPPGAPAPEKITTGAPFNPGGAPKSKPAGRGKVPTGPLEQPYLPGMDPLGPALEKMPVAEAFAGILQDLGLVAGSHMLGRITGGQGDLDYKQAFALSQTQVAIQAERATFVHPVTGETMNAMKYIHEQALLNSTGGGGIWGFFTESDDWAALLPYLNSNTRRVIGTNYAGVRPEDLTVDPNTGQIVVEDEMADYYLQEDVRYTTVTNQLSDTGNVALNIFSPAKGFEKNKAQLDGLHAELLHLESRSSDAQAKEELQGRRGLVKASIDKLTASVEMFKSVATATKGVNVGRLLDVSSSAANEATGVDPFVDHLQTGDYSFESGEARDAAATNLRTAFQSGKAENVIESIAMNILIPRLRASGVDASTISMVVAENVSHLRELGLATQTMLRAENPGLLIRRYQDTIGPLSDALIEGLAESYPEGDVNPALEIITSQLAAASIYGDIAPMNPGTKQTQPLNKGSNESLVESPEVTKSMNRPPLPNEVKWASPTDPSQQLIENYEYLANGFIRRTVWKMDKDGKRGARLNSVVANPHTGDAVITHNTNDYYELLGLEFTSRLETQALGVLNAVMTPEAKIRDLTSEGNQKKLGILDKMGDM